MAEYTLDKFGVPIDGGRQGPLLQPIKKNLFRVRFLNFGAVGNQATPITTNIMSCNLPTLTHEEQTIHSYNSTAYYAGKGTFNAVDMTVRDDVTGTVMRNVAAQMQRQMDHYNQTTYRSATSYKFVTMIEIMDGGNDAVLQQWSGEGCWLVSSNHGELAYDTADAKTITLNIRADNWTALDVNSNRFFSIPASDPQASTL